MDEHEELDSLPFKLRFKLLSNNRTTFTTISPFNVVKNEDQQFDLQVSDPACFALGEGNAKLPQKRSRDGLFEKLSCLGTNTKEHLNSNDMKMNEAAGTVMKEKINPCLSTISSSIKLSKGCGGEEVSFEGNKMINSVDCSVESSFDDIDHITLKERRKLLLSRNVLESTKPVSEGNYSSLSKQAGSVMIQDNHGKDEKEKCSSQSLNGEHPFRYVAARNSHDFCKITELASSTGNTMAKSNYACGTTGSSSSVKIEPMEYDGVLGQDKGVVFTSVSNDHMPVKSEFSEHYYGDKLDHMLLSDRIKLLAPKETSNVSRGFESSKRILPSFLDYSPIASESIPSLKVNRSRKRKKTVTDSVETAMEEDAPELLKVLIDKGVSVNEMKLYGEDNEVLDGSLEESFSDLEAVISKIFFQRQSFLKLGNMRCMKGDKPSYCLACLVSLIEQARYLQFLKWPAEWGWCRDLQSFIFIFERHHRIVLERPEYGYATYFFELVDFLPINWQIKRLVTAMKLTSCGRITLIENRSLVVGDDLTEGEARVLMGYGWTPSSGLGTMLNYRDRVVHDRKNESDRLEWKSKIGKLLMDGYNGGTFVSPAIPEKIVDSSGAEDFQVKLESQLI